MTIQRREDGEMLPKRNYVQPGRRKTIEPMAPHRTSLMVPAQAKQYVYHETSALDRAQGFHLVFVPMAIGVGVLAVMATIALWKVPLLSFTILIVFGVTFMATWLIGLVVNALGTPEAISFYEAKKKWDVIEREQSERWEYYRWQVGMENHEDERRRRDAKPDWMLIWITASICWGVFCFFFYILLGG